MRLYYQDIGKHLHEAASKANHNIFMAAPFIRSYVLGQLFEVINEKVSIVCVTRWRPEEIVQGLNDLEIWDLCKSRQNSKLLLCSNLHAKYYRYDSSAILGSANVTEKAFGWASNSNLEIMVELLNPPNEIGSFESHLLELSVEVDDKIFQEISQAVRNIEKKDMPKIANSQFGESDQKEIYVGKSEEYVWIPKLRNPELLFKVYIEDTEDIIGSTVRAARHDLSSLGIPSGLGEKSFNSYIKILLLQQPVIKYIDRHLDKPRRFGHMRKIIKSFLEKYNIDYDPTMCWQAIMRWILYYMPEIYRLAIPRYSEIIVKK